MKSKKVIILDNIVTQLKYNNEANECSKPNKIKLLEDAKKTVLYKF